MRYYHEKPEIYASMYGECYICNHPIYNRRTLFKIDDRGLAVIQQRFNIDAKTIWWSELDPWLTDVLYLHPKFKSYFDDRSGVYGRIISYCNCETNNVGFKNEAYKTRTMGDSV